jgi:hypothetical protein
MSDPWTVDTNLTDRRMISVPDEAWERVPYGRPDTRLATNEGPQQLINPTTGQNFVVYSAARVNTPFYCLGESGMALGLGWAGGLPCVTDLLYTARLARARRQRSYAVPVLEKAPRRLCLLPEHTIFCVRDWPCELHHES